MLFLYDNTSYDTVNLQNYKLILRRKDENIGDHIIYSDVH